MTVGKENDVDFLSQIYSEMNEAGREKLRTVSKQVLKIWNTVNDERSVSGDKLEFENEN